MCSKARAPSRSAGAAPMLSMTSRTRRTRSATSGVAITQPHRRPDSPYGLSGLRCGWVIATPDVAERVRRVRDVIDNIGAAPADRLGALAFEHIEHLAARARALASTNLDHARAFFA